nr:hypothetical protein [Tanacetum cinerariifolium]
MENVNPSSPPESPNSFLNRKIREFHTPFESLDLAAQPLEKEPSCLEGDAGFVELFKEYEIGVVCDDETEEELMDKELRLEYGLWLGLGALTGEITGLMVGELKG